MTKHLPATSRLVNMGTKGQKPVDELPNGAKTRLTSRKLLLGQIIFGGALIFMSTIFIIRLQWRPLASIGAHVSQSSSSSGKDIDTKSILHPEDHIWRDPEVRKFLWIVSSKFIRPDGVKREVIHINSK